MTTRDPRIYLHPTVARCSSDACDRRSSCARRLAEIPPGAGLEDFDRGSMHPMLGKIPCTRHVSLADAASSRPAAEKRAAKPWPVTEE